MATWRRKRALWAAGCVVTYAATTATWRALVGWLGLL